MGIILVAGASGSGKTTLAHELSMRLAAAGCLTIAVDSYYRNLAHLPFPIREKSNFDHPDSLEHELLIEHIRSLSQGRTVQVPRYDFKTHTREANSTSARPETYIILEGIYSLYWPEIGRLAAHQIFVEAPLELCLQRRVKRDQEQRGRTAESVINQWQTVVEPMYRQFVHPTRENATFLANGELGVDAMVEEVITEIARIDAERGARIVGAPPATT